MKTSANIRLHWAFAAVLLAAFSTLSRATTRDLQELEIGSEICYCAPNTYEFTLDFSLTCPPVNITLGDAVAATTCMVSPFGTPEVADLVPVSVSSIDVLELNQNLQVMVQENISPTEVYLDGDTFSYVSYAAIPGEVVKPEDLPRAIQLNIVGVNKLGEEIINVYLITFTNSCGAYPVLQEGQWAGWTRFSDLGPPDPDLCPLVPTPSPTPFPTMMSMSMSMSMEMGGLEGFSIEDLLDGELEYREYKAEKSKGKGKGGKKEKTKSGAKAGKSGIVNPKETNKLTKPGSKDGKAKDGKAKDGKAKDGKAKDGKAKDGKAKDGKAKDGKAKDGKAKDGKSEKAKDGKSEKAKGGSKAGKSEKYDHKDTNKLTKPGSKDGKAKDGKAKDGKSEKSKDGKAKDGKSEKSKDGKAKDGKSEKTKDGAKGGKTEKTKDGKSEKDYPKETNKLSKPGSKDGKDRPREANKLSKPGSKDGKAKDGKSEKSKDGKSEKAKDGKSQKSRKENKNSIKGENKLKKSEKSKGKGERKRLRI